MIDGELLNCAYHSSFLLISKISSVLKRLKLEIFVLFKPDIMWEETINNGEGEIKVSFGYQCSANGVEIPTGIKLRRTSSFACLSGAALSANATLANTNICNGLIASEILPTLDSPNSFRKVPSSPSLSKFDISSSSLQSCMSNLSCSPSTQTDPLEDDYRSVISVSAPSDSEGFLYSGEVQVAGGAAGEDRVQAVCSEENGWLFCAIYDGFNGRDAADFLAGTLYDTILYYFNFLDWEAKGSFQNITAASINQNFAEKVLDSLQCAVNKAENDFLCMVEQEMEDRPDLVSIGSCALVAILHGSYLYTLNLGDSRAILATYGDGVDVNDPVKLRAIQLTDSHTVDNEAERARILDDHPDDPMTVVAGKVKGKLKVTRAFGVGYLKKVLLLLLQPII